MAIDIPYCWLTFFMEDDDKLEEVRVKYGGGEMLTGEIKEILIKEIQEFLNWFQGERAKVTDEDVAVFKKIRPIKPYPKAWEAEIMAEKK